jgi:arylsulfatase
MPRNILFFMTDQQRSDYVGYASGGKAQTPNIDKIAEYTYFSNCTTANPICTPARSSMITGRYSRQIGMLAMSGSLSTRIPTFMQALRKTGYKTYGIGKFHYIHCGGHDTPRGHGLDHVAMLEETRRYGYDFIWETAGKQNMIPNYCFYGDYLNRKGMLNHVRDFLDECGGINGDTPDHNYDRAIPWPFPEEDYIDEVTAKVALEQLYLHDKTVPFYMMVSFCGPHKPYDAPQRYLDMISADPVDDFILSEDQKITETEKDKLYRQRRSAKAMIRLIDDQIGKILRLLEQRDLMKDTLIIFASDHGDMLGDHYRIQKGVPWSQASKVPLAAWLPGEDKHGENPYPVQLFDIAATVLDYAGLDPQKSLSLHWPAYNDLIPSRSFLPALRGERQRIRDWSYCESDMTEETQTAVDFTEILKKRGAGGRRSNSWRMVADEKYKYIRYLGYQESETAYEEFYDLEKDPNEQHNLISDEMYAERISSLKNRMWYVIDNYPSVQDSWADKFSDHRAVT